MFLLPSWAWQGWIWLCPQVWFSSISQSQDDLNPHAEISSLLKARVQSLSSGPPGSQPRVLALYTLDMKQSQHWSAQQVPWTMCFPISQQVRAVFPTWHRVFLFAAALLTSGKHILQVFASIHVSTSFYSHFRLHFELYTSLYLYILYIFINVVFLYTYTTLCVRIHWNSSISPHLKWQADFSIIHHVLERGD